MVARLVVCRIVPAGPPDDRDEQPHPDAPVEEWVFTCWEPDGSAGLLSGLPARSPPARRRVVLGGAGRHRPPAAARRRVGGAGSRRPAAGQGAGPVGRAHLRRADAPVDGRQRDLRHRPRRPRRRPRPGLRRADAGGVRPRVVRHRRPRRRWPTATSRRASCTASSSWPVARCTSTEVPAHRWHRWGADLGPLERAGGVRPHRACGRRSPSPTARSPTGCSPRTAGALGLPRAARAHGRSGRSGRLTPRPHPQRRPRR